MDALAKKLSLSRDEFAFYFDSKTGVDARELGVFLQRAAMVAKDVGAEIRVVGIEPGSVAVKLRALANSKFASKVKKEFGKAPVGTTAAATGIVAAVAGAIVWAMGSPDVTPVATAGATLIEKTEVTQIKLVTIEQNILIMDHAIAADIRAKQDQRRSRSVLPRSPELKQLTHDARQGTLVGDVKLVDGELHFRPAGYRYLVPIDIINSSGGHLLLPGNYTVQGDILTRSGYPDVIIIHSAVPNSRAALR